MNIILTRTKDEHLNVWWEPFATSTPLKPHKKSNEKIVNVTQEQLLIHNNSPDFVDKLHKNSRAINILQKESAESKQLISKKTRKKKSLTYYDLTSSDEDSSDGNKKRPIIKLRSRKKIKSILVNKNLNNGEIENVEKVNTNEEVNNCKKLENVSVKDCEINAVFSVEDLKCKDVQTHNSVNKTPNGTLKLGLNFKDTSLSSDEGSKIFDEIRKARNITADVTFSYVNKENTINNSKNDDNLKHLSMSDSTGKKETFLTNPNFIKNIHKNYGCNSEDINIPQKRSSEYNISCKSQKRKGKDNESNINIVKKTRTKKPKDKLVMHFVDNPAENSGSLLHMWKCKTNLSHQLFSDSKEQELINILDLTKEEVNEKVKNLERPLMQKKKKLSYKSCNSSHPSINKSFYLNECEKHQPKRKNQNWKKCFTPENLSNELLQNVNTKKKMKSETNSKARVTNNDQVQEFHVQQKSEMLDMLSEGVNEENLIKNDKKDVKAQRKLKRKTENDLEKNKSSPINGFLIKSISNDKLKSSEVNNMPSSVESNTDNNEIADSNKPSVPEDKKAFNKKKPVFKLLNELSYKESEMGCSVAQGWSINNFKCGVFKLKVKSQMTCKTLHDSSNLGGVLIRGNLKMKIGNRELNLTEGDMVFVPPLTEWQATNIGKCEALFYYWCGRFNV